MCGKRGAPCNTTALQLVLTSGFDGASRSRARNKVLATVKNQNIGIAMETDFRESSRAIANVSELKYDGKSLHLK